MRIESEILQHIRALPIFSGLDASALNVLVSRAQLREFSKGKTLFRQGESLPKFYLVVEGWVKIFKGSNTGDEAILQMRTNGDALMAPSVFLDIPALANAQLVQDTTLLVLPASLIRKQVQENGKLAQNVINSLANYSQDLIQKIEHSQLMTAIERVGWFLLKLGLEQSQGRAATIRLPYDKSTIASYLDMTPETFSRTLKQFKNKGFRIQSGLVTKPTANALCGFCDDTLSRHCWLESCTVKAGACSS
ncbi:MAG: hypothetical protein COA69_05830 [Robiginitomaculum sp.]|nr:MAG: hypothetical protein COA69_05830 [Robiginitomaculum sp.]